MSILLNKIGTGIRDLPRDLISVLAAHVLLLVFAGICGSFASDPPTFKTSFGRGGGGGVMRVRAVNFGRESGLRKTGAISPKSAELRKDQSSGGSKNIHKTVQAKSSALNSHLSRYKDNSSAVQVKKTAKNPAKDETKKAVSAIVNKNKPSAGQLAGNNQAAARLQTLAKGRAAKLTEGESMGGSGAMFSWGGSGIGGGSAGGGNGLIGIVEEHQQEIMQSVSYFWERPEGLSAGDYCCYIVDLAMDGHITKLKLERSSGNLRLEASAKAAIVSSDPLPIPTDSDLYKKFKQLRLIFRGDGLLGGSN